MHNPSCSYRNDSLPSKCTGGYRFGFNGMESEPTIYGEGNAYDFGARMYDGRIGRWWSVDPLHCKYPSFSSYNYVLNAPIIAVDPSGADVIIVIWQSQSGNQGHVAIAVEEYHEVNGKIQSKGTYTLYQAMAIDQNDIMSFVMERAKIKTGIVTNREGVTLNDLKSAPFGTTRRPTVLYKIETTLQDDKWAHIELSSLSVSSMEQIANPYYGTDDSESPYLEFYEPTI